MAISWKAVPIRTNAQEIATAYGLAMTYWVHAANSPHIVTVHRAYRIAPSVIKPCWAWLYDSSPTLTRRGAFGAADEIPHPAG